MDLRDKAKWTATGERLRVLCARKRMSGSRLARETGIPQPSISKIMNGIQNMQPEQAEAIARALEIQPQELLWGLEGDNFKPASPTVIEGITSSKRVRLLGVVKMGVPMFSDEQIDEYVSIPDDICPEGCFALEAIGDSMSGDLIGDKDILVFRPAETAENGKIVLAAVRGAQTVKRFFLRKDRVELRPSNPAHPPIIAALDDVEIKGVLVYLTRRFGG